MVLDTQMVIDLALQVSEEKDIRGGYVRLTEMGEPPMFMPQDCCDLAEAENHNMQHLRLALQSCGNLSTQLLQQLNNKLCVQKSLMGGVLVGGAAALGGVLFGPVGLAVGGTIGGVGSALFMQGEFKSAYTVISEMSPSQKQALADKLRVVLNQVDVTDALALTALLASGNSNVKELLFKELVGYLNSNMNMRVIC